MRKTLKNKLTGSMMLAVAAALAIVSVCLLLGVTRYSGAQFSQEVAEVFTTDLLEELNAGATGSAESAASAVAQAVDANAGRLRIGAGREYTVWDVESGNCVGGSARDAAAATGNIVTAMNGAVGDSIPLFASRMDIAIPVTRDVSLVVDIADDGGAMRALCWHIALLLAIAGVISLAACLLLSRQMAGAFVASAAQTAQDIRTKADDALRPAGDWEAMALALYQPAPPRRRKARETADAMHSVLPYLRDGYVRFSVDGSIVEMNAAAQNLLGVAFPSGEGEEPLTFEQAFRGVPLPDETHGMIHGQFTQGGRRLDVVFVALGDGAFAAVLHLAAGRAVP